MSLKDLAEVKVKEPGYGKPHMDKAFHGHNHVDGNDNATDNGNGDTYG